MRSPAALSRAVGSQVLACLPEWDEVDLLSTSGGVIWKVLAEPRTLSELTARIADEFELRPAHVRGDVRGFVDLLVKRGLVQRMPSSGNGKRARAGKETR
jgi:hypothetical protein